MATFPKAEAKILKLARVVIDGLRAASEDFPNMPVSPDELQHLLDEVEADLIAVTAAKAAYHECHKRKDRSLYQLKRALKAVLAIAEVAARRHPERLTGLGWGPRREPRPQHQDRSPRGDLRPALVEAAGGRWSRRRLPDPGQARRQPLEGRARVHHAVSPAGRPAAGRGPGVSGSGAEQGRHGEPERHGDVRAVTRLRRPGARASPRAPTPA